MTNPGDIGPDGRVRLRCYLSIADWRGRYGVVSRSGQLNLACYHIAGANNVRLN